MRRSAAATLASISVGPDSNMYSSKDNDTEEIPLSESEVIVSSPESGVAHQEAELVAYEETFQGPLPPPETLAQYEAILPGSAERLMVMAENQAEHRQKVEMTVVTTAKFSIERESKRAYRGLTSAALISIILILCGTFLVYNGHDWAGATMIVSTIVGIVGVFVYGTQTRRSERLESMRSSELVPEYSEQDD